MRFRPHRGSFIDSIDGMVEVRSINQIMDEFNDGCPIKARFVEFSQSIFDPREPWNAKTFYVIGQFAEEPPFVIGMTDSDQFDETT